MSHKNSMVTAYSLYNITKIYFIYKHTNDRVMPQWLSNYFWGYWELPNNRVANGNRVNQHNPGSDWQTDINPIE